MFDDVILWPREQARYSLPAAIDAFAERREVRIIDTLPAFQIPDDPTWRENPFNSRSWQLYYNSLGWLYAAEGAYKEGRFPDFVDYAKSMILDYFTDNPDPSEPLNPMAWHDGGNAFRLATISYLYETYFKPGNAAGTSVTFTPAEAEIFRQGLENSRDQVLFRLGQDMWADSNHRFFHAMGLSSYATVFGNAEGTPFFEEDAQALLNQGLAAVDQILGAVVNLDTGVTREQSLMYDRLDLGLMLEAEASITEHGFGLERDYTDVIQRMLEFDVLARHPTGSGNEYLAPVGDSYYGRPSGVTYVNDALAGGRELSPVTEWVLSRGAEGERPPDLIDYSSSGYVIMRPEYAWEDPRDTRLLFDVTEKAAAYPHGHFDNTNVILSSFGQPILVDSGGPYSYDHAPELPDLPAPFKTAYFNTSEAHNVLVVDNTSFDADTRVRRLADNDIFSFASASQSGYPGISVTRDVLVIKGGPTLILDAADNTTGRSHRYEVNWHFDPKATGVDAAPDGEFRIGNVFVDTAFATSGAATYAVIEGRLGDRPQGWVTSGQYTATPAPVLEVARQTAADAWFVSAFGTSQNAADDLTLNATATANGYSIDVAYGGQAWKVHITDAGNVTVVPRDGARHGTTGNDQLTGTSRADTMFGHDGDDILIGLGGDDTLHGDSGRDTLRGGDGADALFGGDGNDALYGEDGANTLYGEGGGDRLVGGDRGREVLDGGSGNDELFGNGDSDRLLGGDGDDRLNGGDGRDTLNGGKGNDLVAGGSGDDLFFIDVGNDRYYGEDGADIAIFTGLRDDFLIEQRGAYLQVTDLDPGNGDLGTDLLAGIETLRFSDADYFV